MIVKDVAFVVEVVVNDDDDNDDNDDDNSNNDFSRNLFTIVYFLSYLLQRCYALHNHVNEQNRKHNSQLKNLTCSKKRCFYKTVF